MPKWYQNNGKEHEQDDEIQQKIKQEGQQVGEEPHGLQGEGCQEHPQGGAGWLAVDAWQDEEQVQDLQGQELQEGGGERIQEGSEIYSI